MICCICLDDNDTDHMVKSPNCQCKEAIYHRECVDQHIKFGEQRSGGPCCPICRTKITSKEEIKYKVNFIVLFVYALIIMTSIVIEIFLPSKTAENFIIQTLILVTLGGAIFHKEIIKIAYHLIPV